MKWFDTCQTAAVADIARGDPARGGAPYLKPGNAMWSALPLPLSAHRQLAQRILTRGGCGILIRVANTPDTPVALTAVRNLTMRKFYTKSPGAKLTEPLWGAVAGVQEGQVLISRVSRHDIRHLASGLHSSQGASDIVAGRRG